MRIWTSSQFRRRLTTAVCACALLVVVATGCGEKDFANDPRPASTEQLTALINDKTVIVSPKPEGAGPVTITISNQSGNPAKLVLTKGTKSISSPELPANGGTGSIQANLEQGDYTASVGDSVGVGTDKITVGPDRPSAQNELLLP